MPGPLLSSGLRRRFAHCNDGASLRSFPLQPTRDPSFDHIALRRRQSTCAVMPIRYTVVVMAGLP
jgi:hypothetical protein